MSHKVLIVDDNPLNLELVSQLLEDEFVIETATNGQEAIEAVERFAPDLVLMDLSMPVMDGWEATKELRTRYSSSELKIIALSAHAIPVEMERATLAGCDTFVTKPIDDDLLMHDIRLLLGL